MSIYSIARQVPKALADADYTRSRPKVLFVFDLSTIEPEQPIMGMKASLFLRQTNFDQDWALPDLTKSIVAMTRQDSDLEAFSHNPTDGSFTALLARATVCANCPNLRFLSY